MPKSARQVAVCKRTLISKMYLSSRDEFAYAASDKLVYIRKFSNKCSNMKLTGILQGHEADVTQV